MNGINRRPARYGSASHSRPRNAAAAIAARRGDIGRTVISVRAVRPVVSRSISVIIGSGRGADDGATDQSARYGGAEVPLGVGGSRSAHGRNGQGGDGSKCHQSFPHGFTFLIGQV